MLTVGGGAELVARAGHLFRAVREEFRCAAVDLRTGPGRPGQPAAPSARRPEVVVRKLCTPRVLDDEDSRRHLDRIVAAGGRVRICAAALPPQTIVRYGRIAFLAGPYDRATRSVSVLRDPAAVAGYGAPPRRVGRRDGTVGVPGGCAPGLR